MVVTLSRGATCAASRSANTGRSTRGGRGVIGATTKDEDLIAKLFIASTHDHVLMFTNSGRVYSKRVFDLPEAAVAIFKGKALVNFLELQPGERVIEICRCRPSTPASSSFGDAERRGQKTELDAFSSIRSTGIIAIDIDEGDTLVGARVTDGRATSPCVPARLGGSAFPRRRSAPWAAPPAASGIKLRETTKWSPCRCSTRPAHHPAHRLQKGLRQAHPDHRLPGQGPRRQGRHHHQDQQRNGKRRRRAGGHRLR